MNTLKRMTGLLLVGLCTALALTGCPDEAFEDNDNDEEPECFNDEECAEDAEICYGEDGESDFYEAQTCVETCESTEDCFEGEVCRDRDDIDSDETICLEPPAECTDSDQCPTGWICDGNEDDPGECVDTDEPSYNTVLIEDATREHGEEDRCPDSTYGFDTSGAKIYDVILFDEDTGEEYAVATDFHPGDDTNFGDAFSIFDGTAPDFETSCPDMETFNRLDDGEEYTSTFNEDSVLALGCDGKLFLQFQDEDGDLIELEDGQQLEVYSYGQQCSDEYQQEHGGGYSPQSADDPYFVDLCYDIEPNGTVDDLDRCDRTLTVDPAFGITFHDVEL